MTVKFVVTRPITFEEYIPLADELASLSLGTALLSSSGSNIYISNVRTMLVIDLEKMKNHILCLRLEDGAEPIEVVATEIIF